MAEFLTGRSHSPALGAARHAPTDRTGPVDHRAAAAVELDVLTYNVFLGERWDQARKVLRDNPADLICLQEVVGEPYGGRFVRPSQAAEAVPGVWNFIELWRRPPFALGNMCIARRGAVGPARALRAPPSAPYGTWSEMRLGAARFIVANIHLTPMLGPPLVTFALTEHHRMRESIDLSRRIRAARLPVIALGDFNTFRASPAYWLARRGLRDARDFARGRQPATRPTYGLPFVIDHVFVTPEIDVLGYEVIVAPGSDHRAIRVRLRVPAVTDPGRGRIDGGTAGPR